MSFHVRARELPGGEFRDIFVVDGRFTFTAPDDAETIFDDGYVLPGLVDAHAHLELWSPAGDDKPVDERVRASALAQLEAGVLALREPGCPERASIRIAGEDGLPRITTAGRFLAPAGGYMPDFARVTTPEELPDAAVEELAGSGAWVKVIGDWFRDGDLQPNYPLDALVETSKRVHAAGGRVAIHAVIPESVERAIEAGFDTIEHGTMISSDVIKAMAAANVAWVPTMVIAAPLRDLIRRVGVSDREIDRLEHGLEVHGELVAEAFESGVSVYAGTDAGMVPHGVISKEIEMFIAGGVSPERAIGAASWDARSFFGYPGIEEGAPADLVAYRDDPRADASALQRPALILLGGRRIR